MLLIFVEHDNSTIKKSSLELIAKADELKLAPDEPVILEVLEARADAKVLSDTIDKHKPRIVLASNSLNAKDVFPKVAARLKIGLATDVVDLKIDNGKLIAKKPLYAGKAFCEVHFSTEIQMALVRPNSFAIKEEICDRLSELQHLNTSTLKHSDSPSATLVETLTDATSKQTDITEAEIIVAGGRGMGSKENFDLLSQLAETLGGTVGASRAAVDAEFATHAMQVGQTGKVVSPKLYIACGISGAIQHWAGIRTAKTIVAINKDKDAPIFQKANYGIVGDALEILPKLADALKQG